MAANSNAEFSIGRG